MDDGVCGTIEELAKREKFNQGYISRVLRLALLAPGIVEAILEGQHPEGMRLEDLLKGCPVEWDAQEGQLRRRP
jgi:ParB-like chromosome segregation protein Spo0J